MTAEERIRFAVEFSGLDLPRLRKGDWSNLFDDIRAFLGRRESFSAESTNQEGGFTGHAPAVAIASQVGRGIRVSNESDVVVRVDEKRVRNLQRKVRTALECVEAGRPMEAFTVKFQPVANSRARVELQLRDATSLTAVFLPVLYFALIDATAGQVRRCPNCDEIFFRVGKRIFCSDRCRNAVALRKHLSKPANVRKRRASARKAYAKRKQEQLGARVKVRHRKA